jgi:hypothetical protein
MILQRALRPSITAAARYHGLPLIPERSSCGGELSCWLSHARQGTGDRARPSRSRQSLPDALLKFASYRGRPSRFPSLGQRGGMTWILDGLEVTVVGAIRPVLQNPQTLAYPPDRSA